MSELMIWRFTPVAKQVDPAWQGRRIWQRLDVVAPSAGEAILAAIRYEQLEAGRSDDRSQDHQQARSGFEDERLYRVDRLPDPPPSGAASGEIVFPV